MKTLTWPRAVGAAAALALLVVVVAREPWLRSEAPASPGSAPSVAAVAAESSSPPSPPARICGSSRLRGPATRPAHAVRVSPTQHLPALVASKAAGTTFWLAPGVHVLGGGAYDSVRPKSGDTFIGAPGAVISGQHRNLYAFAGSAKHVTIEHLRIQNFGSPGDNNNEGVVNHDSAAHWTLRWTTVTANAGAGVMIGSGNVISHSCLSNNGQYGFNAYSPSGVAYVSLLSNEIAGNNTDKWEHRQPGCGCTGGGKFWETRHAKVVGNYVHDNMSVGLWADTNNRDFLFKGNYISDNDAEGIMYEISYNAAILNNTFIRNGTVEGPTNPGFPTGAIYISESGSDRRVTGHYSRSLVISGNLFRDNWSGVVAWENADRFAGSPANSSSGYTTLVNPRVATAKKCATADLVKRKPYINDCRWKTQHLVVTKNTFSFSPAHLGSKCTAANGCGFNGLFSNYGTYPDWSPYKGTVVEKHITFSQHNLWTHNSYFGPWRFMALQAGHTVSWTRWRSTYHQDAGSKKSR